MLSADRTAPEEEVVVVVGETELQKRVQAERTRLAMQVRAAAVAERRTPCVALQIVCVFGFQYLIDCYDLYHNR